MSEVQPLMLYGDKQLTELKTMITERTQNWLIRMGYADMTLTIALVSPAKALQSDELWFLSGEAGIAIKKNNGLSLFLTTLCFEHAQNVNQIPVDSLPERIIYQALSCWLEQLQLPVCLTLQPANSQAFAHISHVNGLLAKLTINGALIEMLLPYNLIKGWLPEQPLPPTDLMPFSLANLVSNEKIILKAQLASSAISLRDLPSLQVGDVLRLSYQLDQLIKLKLTTGETILQGNLGQFGDQFAIKIDNKRGNL